MEIRIFLAGNEMGPYSESQVRDYLGEGLVAPSDLALSEDGTEWEPLGQLLSRLADHKASLENARDGAAPRPITIRTAAKAGNKRGPITLQPMFAEGDAARKNRTGKTALTIATPRPTTQLPPVAKFEPREDRKNAKGIISTGPLAPANFFAHAVPQPATETAPAVAPEAAHAAHSGEAGLPGDGPHTASQPSARSNTLEPEQMEALPNVIIYSAAVIGLVLLGAVGGIVYLVWHLSTPAPRNALAASPGASSKASATPGASTTPQTSNQYAARGDARLSQSDLEGALADYDQAIILDPQNARAFFQRAIARQTKGDWDGALCDYNTLLTLQPDNANAFSNRGFVRQTRGDLDGALADYSEALARDPTIAVADYNIGLIQVRRGNLDGAIEAYNRALDINPKLTRAYYNRGKAKSAEGNVDGAIADYTQALALDPNIASAYLERGIARQAKGDADGAMGDYSQAVEHDSNLAAAYYDRGYVELLRGDLAATISDSTRAISLMPDNAKAYSNRGMAELAQGTFDRAEADLRKYCQLAPRDPDCDCARLYLWVSVTRQNAQDRADQDLATSLQNDWNSPPEDLTSKIAAFLLGHTREPELIADAASPDLTREPGRYCKAWYFAGIKRLVAGDAPTAFAYFQKAVATDQKNFCEYVFARAQLVSLGETRQASSQPPAPTPP